MATDLDTGNEPGEPALARPSLKITGLHIRGLKSIGSLDLPGDGLGWDGPIPDMVMIGGINGSGKTTLLEFLASAFEFMTTYGEARTITDVPPALRAREAWIDFEYSVAVYGVNDLTIRFLIGDSQFIESNASQNWLGIQDIGADGMAKAIEVCGLSETLNLFFSYIKNGSRGRNHANDPAVVFLPTERELVVPATSYKMPGDLTPPGEFAQRWRPPEEWGDSLPARLYALRWKDLNAKEEGRPEDATHFRAYQLAFDRFFEGRKQIRWTHRGELVVETKGGATHDLSELSSGEKQVILFMGELLHRWRPGSLILIDEPELHLHESYQTRLWESLVGWQKERGGQVIMATQSVYLFGLSGLGTRVVLNDRRSR